jgi:hypothetical protein
MYVAVTFNADGHFEVAKVEERDDTWLLLKNISWGEFYEDQVADNDLEEYEQEDIHKLTDYEWRSYLSNFETRGQFEIIEI